MKIEPLAVSVSEAADAIGVSRAMCYRLIATGRLRSIRVGSRRGTRVPVEALRALVLGRQDSGSEDVAPAADRLA